MELSLLVITFSTVYLIMSLGWMYQLKEKNTGIVDVLWAFSVGLLGVIFSATGETIFIRKLLLIIMVSTWSIRLGSYILLDRVMGKPEDGRYQNLRQHWGAGHQSKLFWFFQAQGCAAAFFSIPFYFISRNPNETFSVPELIGLSLWAISFFGEWLSDRQLELFKRDSQNKGKTCRVGLWRYSRHPNYFFEWLIWRSYSLMLFNQAGFYASLLCPIAMLISLFKLTGIPHTEAQAIRSRGDDYRQYQAETSVFIPWFPRLG